MVEKGHGIATNKALYAIATVMISYDDFEKVEIRTGTILEASLIPDARYSTHYLLIDCGEEIGIKKSCARLTNYKPEDLVGRQIIAVVNFPAKQIGKNMSEVLCLGVPDDQGNCVLVSPDSSVFNGVKLF